MAGTVTLEQLDKLNSIIGSKATSLATAVIRLHSSENEEKKWVYSGLCGALCLVIDRKLGGVALFRMYDLNSFNLVFEAELYYEFEQHYTEINDNFYCFPIPGGHHIGFSFADSEEALMFRSLAAKYAPRSQYHNRNEERIKRYTLPTDNDAIKKKPGFFKNLFSKKKMSDDGEEVSIDNYKISRPENAIHENHIGWDAKNQTFDLSQLSRELKRVFKKAGIRKKDLKDTNTALLIADAILNQPLPDSNPTKKGKKGADKASAKKDAKEEHHSEQGTPQIGALSRSSSIIGSGIKPLQLNASMSATDGKKSGFQSNIPSAGDKKSMNLSKQEEMSLTSKLATAMAQRRKALTKHDVESEEDDWSEDD